MYNPNIKLYDADYSFEASTSVDEHGSIDIYEVVKSLSDFDWDGAIRAAYGHMIWGKIWRSGHGLYFRAIEAIYLLGLWKAERKVAGKTVSKNR